MFPPPGPVHPLRRGPKGRSTLHAQPRCPAPCRPGRGGRSCINAVPLPAAPAGAASHLPMRVRCSGWAGGSRVSRASPASGSWGGAGGDLPRSPHSPSRPRGARGQRPHGQVLPGLPGRCVLKHMIISCTRLRKHGLCLLHLFAINIPTVSPSGRCGRPQGRGPGARYCVPSSTLRAPAWGPFIVPKSLVGVCAAPVTGEIHGEADRAHLLLPRWARRATHSRPWD